MATGVFDVAAVRAAEQAAMAGLPEGALMQRASGGLESTVASLLTEVRRGVAGSRVVVLVGSGNNGGDALWAAAGLTRRGATGVAITMSDSWHTDGMHAFEAASGRRVPAAGWDREALVALVSQADVIIDGITGIGGRGGLRGSAAEIARIVSESPGLVVAVDIPSGVDADTGWVADTDACVTADVTVTFGCLKPGLVIAPGRFHMGGIRMVDIGLGPHLPHASLQILDDLDIAELIPEPDGADYKYSRGVVGVAAGSREYRGAAYLATDAARASGVGMVRFLGRDRSLSESIVGTFWDVVVSEEVADPRVTGYVIGCGLGRDDSAAHLLDEVLALDEPVVVDADALRLLQRPSLREALLQRADRGQVTVLTPHEGEFASLGFDIGTDRLAAAREAARELRSVLLLKGPGTIVAAPTGEAFVDTIATAVLGTAGSGDVLSGLLGGMLAGAAARSRSDGTDLDAIAAAQIAAAAAGLHGLAGRIAAEGGRPVTARDVVRDLPDAIARVRRG
jgi:ADP-dependent NAD(P)H-hydrate dehydratase / NAD(P)H-hydrate epimerase